MNFVKLFVSSGVAFVMAIAFAYLIETFGGATGGIIASFPTTIIPAVYIILEDTTQPLQSRFDSALACIIGMFCTNILFMPTWKLFPPYFPKKWSNGMVVFVMTILSLLVWFVSAIALTLLQQWMASLGVSMFAFCFCLLLLGVVCGGALCWRLPPAPAGKNKVKWYVHFLRGFVASLAILASGILSQTGSGVAAGAVSTFPAMFITTMVSVSLSQGAEVSTGAIGPLLLGGNTSGWFSVLCVGMVKFFNLPVIWVCVIGFFLDAVCWSVPVYYFIRWRRRATARLTDKVIAKAVAENNEVEMKTMKGHSAENEAANVHGDAVISVPPQENGVSVPAQENGVAMPPQENGVAMPPQENGVAMPPQENGVTMPQENAIAIPPQENAVSTPHQETVV